MQNLIKYKLQVLHSVQKQAKHIAQTGMAPVASMNVMETLNQNAGVCLIQIYISYPGAETQQERKNSIQFHQNGANIEFVKVNSNKICK